MIYFDTSYLVRLYLEDKGFEAVRHLAEANEVACSLHGRGECAAAFHRCFREGRYGGNHLNRLLDQFESDCTNGAYRWCPVTEAIVTCVVTSYREPPGRVFLRAADAMHLACAADNGFKEIHSNDERLLAAASVFGLKGRNVIK
jgi:predicted nucleic acid-binding protein